MGSTQQIIVKVLGGKCSRCGSIKKLELHNKGENHVNDDLSNVELLCQKCRKRTEREKAKRTKESILNFSEDVPKLSRYQKFVLRLWGHVFVGYHTLFGHRCAVPCYVVRCPVHGLYVGTLHGVAGSFQCSLCLSELKVKRGGFC